MPELTEGVDQQTAGNTTEGSIDENPQPTQEADFGFAPPSSDPPVSDPATPEGNGTQPNATDPGVVTRLEQANARQAKALLALGINPDSTMIDQFEKGLLTADDLRQLTSPTQQVVQNTAPPQKSPAEILREVSAKVKEKQDATLEDFETLAEATAQFIENREASDQQTAMANQANACQQAVYSVFDSDSSNPIEDQAVKATEREIFFAATDLDVSLEARKTANPYGMMTPDTYAFYANQTKGKLAAVKQAYIDYGRKLEREGVPPAPAQKIIAPVAPGQGAPVAQPKVKVTVDNMAEARKAYRANFNKRV
jgi:hypothetical protein